MDASSWRGTKLRAGTILPLQKKGRLVKKLTSIFMSKSFPTCIALFTRLWWLKSAAFGVPVVPYDRNKCRL